MFETKDNRLGMPKTSVSSVSIILQRSNNQMKIGGNISAVATTVLCTLQKAKRQHSYDLQNLTNPVHLYAFAFLGVYTNCC